MGPVIESWIAAQFLADPRMFPWKWETSCRMSLPSSQFQSWCHARLSGVDSSDPTGRILLCNQSQSCWSVYKDQRCHLNQSNPSLLWQRLSFIRLVISPPFLLRVLIYISVDSIRLDLLQTVQTLRIRPSRWTFYSSQVVQWRCLGPSLYYPR